MTQRRNRMWTAEEKRSICHQTRAPGVSVAQVGRRYAFNTNMIHKWLRVRRHDKLALWRHEELARLVS